MHTRNSFKTWIDTFNTTKLKYNPSSASYCAQKPKIIPWLWQKNWKLWTLTIQFRYDSILHAQVKRIKTKAEQYITFESPKLFLDFDKKLKKNAN